MGLGGKVERNVVVKIKDGEVLVQKDNTGILLNAAGKSSRESSLEWALQPEEILASWPFILSILPAPAACGNLSKQQAQQPMTALPSVHIHSIPSLNLTQAIRVPPVPETISSDRPVSIIDVPPPPVTQAARLMTAGPKGRAPLAIVTQPLSELSSSTSSSTRASTARIYLLQLLPWSQQLDSLISHGQYTEALSLLSSLDSSENVVPDATARLKKLRMLAGLALFLDKQKYDAAIDVFIEENVNPAKVIALFPKAISGKLYCERNEVEEIWGGRTKEDLQQQEHEQSGILPRRNRISSERKRQATPETSSSAEADDIANPNRSQSGSLPQAERPGRRFTPAKKKEDDTASVKSVTSKRSQSALSVSKEARDSSPALGAVPEVKKEDGKRSIEGLTTATLNLVVCTDLSFKLSTDVLVRYLPDRRQQIMRALSALPPGVRPSPSTPLPSTSPNSAFNFFDLPDESLTTYTPEQLQRTAQVVETALFKCYLHAKPGLLGPLCRIENWCEVEEVEELLLAAKVSYTEQPCSGG